jgi:hypothetical protein
MRLWEVMDDQERKDYLRSYFDFHIEFTMECSQKCAAALEPHMLETYSKYLCADATDRVPVPTHDPTYPHHFYINLSNVDVRSRFRFLWSTISGYEL